MSDPILDRLRRYAEQNKSEPWLPVKAPELLALVAIAEAVHPALMEVDWESDCNCLQCSALNKLSAAVAKLEAL